MQKCKSKNEDCSLFSHCKVFQFILLYFRRWILIPIFLIRAGGNLYSLSDISKDHFYLLLISQGHVSKLLIFRSFFYFIIFFPDLPFFKSLNALSHLVVSHQVWILSCFLRWPESLNFFSHFEQLNGFSSVWILSCLFKLPACANIFSHFEQLKGS